MALPTKKTLAYVGGTDRRPRMLGRYHVLDEIGRNDVGPLYLARLEGPKGFQRWAAIRRVDRRHLAEDGYIQGFYERVRAGAKLLHPNVCALFDVGEEEGVPWVAMEYLHGERVETAIDRLEFADTPASWEIAARMIADAAAGVQAVHDLRDKEGAPLGMMHGDLAAHSLVVTYDGKTKIKGAFEPRVHGVLDPRKIAYAAPEQLFDGVVDSRADVFALGALLWELLAGKRLFARATEDETRAMIEAGVVPSLLEIAEDVPRDLDGLVRRALARSPSQRFTTARDFSRELESLLVSRGVVARDDDVGRYMRTLFADRYTDQEARLQAASDITEIWRKSQHSLPTPQGPASRALAAIPDVSVRDGEEDAEATELMRSPLSSEDDHTTAERPAAKGLRNEISGYTDEIVADSGPTNPRNKPPPIPAFNDTDEIPTMTAPQTPISAPAPISAPRTKPSASKATKPMAQKPIATTLPLPTQPMPTRRDRSDDDTQTAPNKDANGSGASRLIMPSSLMTDGEVTESAIFVAPRIPIPTPPDTEQMISPGPPRPIGPSFPDRPLLPSTPQAGIHTAPMQLTEPWPPPPPSPPPYQSSRPPPAYSQPFTPPPAFPQHSPVSRGPHAAMSTMSLKAVLFPRDRAKRIVVVSIVGLVGGAILFFVFFAVWHSVDQATPATTSTATASVPPAVTTSKPVQSATIAAPPPSVSVAPPRPTATIPQIPTMELTPTTNRRRGGGTATTSRPPATATTHEREVHETPPPPPTAIAASGKTGFLTVMCKPVACDRILDGSRDLGGSPLYRQEITSGKHTLTLRVDSTHAQKIVTVDVPEGETVTIRPDVSQ